MDSFVNASKLNEIIYLLGKAETSVFFHSDYEIDKDVLEEA